MASRKLQYWQMIRGICILAVILIHCKSMVRYPLDDFDTKYYFVVRNFINFPVAVFFFISGKFSKSRGVKETLHRVMYLMIPYVVYSTIYIVTPMFFGTSYTFLQIAKMYILATASAPLYYIWVLIYYTLLTPFLHKFITRPWLIVCLCVIPLIVAYILEFCGISVWNYLKYTTIWLPFYFAGIVHQKIPIKINKIGLAISFAVFLFVLQLMETYFMLRSQMYAIAYSQMRISGCLYAWSIVLLICCAENRARETKTMRVLAIIGDYSYGIYYLHSMFIMIYNQLLINQIHTPLIVERGMQLIFSLSMSFAAIHIIRLVFKNRYSKALFGV